MPLGSINRITQAFIIGLLLTMASLAMAEPSRQEIDQALKAGDSAKAKTLMIEVLAAHPDSARAHFKYSEMLAAEGRMAEAKTELSKAKHIEPGLGFAKPEAVTNLMRKLSNSAHTTTATANSANPLVLWGGMALAGLLMVMVFRSFRRPPVPQHYANHSSVPNGYGQQAGYAPQGGGMASGIMGGLATGAAVGAGIVAGEILMHKIVDDGHANTNNSDPAYNQSTPDPTSDISGNDFVNTDNGSWDNDSYGDSPSTDSASSNDWL